MLLKTKRLSETAKLPVRAYLGDAGLDLFADEDVDLRFNHIHTIRTGIAIELPYGTVGLILDRGSSSAELSTISGLKVMGGVIDSGYRGELFVPLAWIAHHGFIQENRRITRGDKIAQLVVFPIFYPGIYEVKELTSSERNTQAFGSSNNKGE